MKIKLYAKGVINQSVKQWPSSQERDLFLDLSKAFFKPVLIDFSLDHAVTIIDCFNVARERSEGIVVYPQKPIITSILPNEKYQEVLRIDNEGNVTIEIHKKADEQTNPLFSLIFENAANIIQSIINAIESNNIEGYKLSDRQWLELVIACKTENEAKIIKKELKQTQSENCTFLKKPMLWVINRSKVLHQENNEGSYKDIRFCVIPSAEGIYRLKEGFLEKI